MKNIKTFEAFKSQKYPCTFSIVTDKKTDGPKSVKNNGYHFTAKNKEELDNLKEKYKKGDIYNGNKIVSVSVNVEDFGTN